jgi:DNA-binding transcriptional LysR family regulator
MDFTSRQLRAFVLVARKQSFSRAAEALFITPSGISVLIRELEAQLGFRLFDRTTRQVSLTTWGSELLAVAERTLQEIEAEAARLERSATTAHRSFTIGAMPLFAAHVLPGAIKEFSAQHPEAGIQVFDGDGADVRALIEAGRVDVGLGGFLQPTKGIRRMVLFRFTLMLVEAASVDSCSRPSRARDFIAWKDVPGERLLPLSSVIPLQYIIDKCLTQAGIVTRPPYSLNHIETQLAMVEAGLGVAIVPSFAFMACQHRHVALRRLVSPTVQMDFYQARSRARKLPAVVDEFILFLKGYLARQLGPLSGTEQSHRSGSAETRCSRG